jgi:hypothetical protein
MNVVKLSYGDGAEGMINSRATSQFSNYFIFTRYVNLTYHID